MSVTHIASDVDEALIEAYNIANLTHPKSAIIILLSPDDVRIETSSDLDPRQILEVLAELAALYDAELSAH